ncbi:MAG: hypothetical protein AAGI01_05335 [Myxococcota bacterium]
MFERVLKASLALLLCLLALVSVGCKDQTCARMVDCCAASKDAPGMGTACGKLAQGSTNPDTCMSVIRTVQFMHEDRGSEIPPECRTPELNAKK